MLWRLILEEFGTNIQQIAGVDNIVADTLSRFTSTSIDKYDTCTRKAQCRTNELFTIGRVEKKEYPPPNKSINCTKRKTKTTEKYKLQTQYINFRLGIRLLQASS